MYQDITPYAGDPILSLVETFIKDPREHKINLSIGIYFDETGKMPLPASVESAGQSIPVQAQSYLPMEGHAGFRAQIAPLLLGGQHDAIAEQRIVSVQTIGGSGALKLAADFLHRWFPDTKVYISDPTWDNHRSIFEGAGFEVETYPYYDAATIGVKFDEMKTFFAALPKHSVVLLHPCCHNPTGVDLSQAQWDELLTIVQQRGLIALMDIAYLGFGDGFVSDAYAVRRAAELGIPLWVSVSFSKNMSLYGERVGALMVVTPSAKEAEIVLGQLKFTVRRIYSSPPAHGALVAYHVLSDASRREQWQQEVAAMRERIKAMRQALYDKLSQMLPEYDFSYFIKQRGMFGYTGLSPQQVQRLQDEFAVYLLQTGRMCIAGLNEGNIDAVAEALAQVYRD